MWFRDAAIASGLWGLANVLQDAFTHKRPGGVASRKGEPAQQVAVWITFHIAAALALLPAVGLALPDRPVEVALIGLFHLGTALAFLQTYAIGDATQVGPLLLAAPVLSVLSCGVFLGEALGPAEAGAVMLLVAGAAWLRWSGSVRKGLLGLMLLYASCFAAYSTFLRSASAAVSHRQAFVWSRFAALGGFLLLLLVPRFRASVLRFRSLAPGTQGLSLLSGAADGTASVLLFSAVSLAPKAGLATTAILAGIPAWIFVIAAAAGFLIPAYGKGRLVRMPQKLAGFLAIAAGYWLIS